MIFPSPQSRRTWSFRMLLFFGRVISLGQDYRQRVRHAEAATTFSLAKRPLWSFEVIKHYHQIDGGTTMVFASDLELLRSLLNETYHPKQVPTFEDFEDLTQCQYWKTWPLRSCVAKLGPCGRISQGKLALRVSVAQEPYYIKLYQFQLLRGGTHRKH